MATIAINHLDVWYGGFHAVKDVSLQIDDGEFCVFLGPSGCGKTTTLRSIAGLVRPASGQILLDGQVINDLYPGERDIAMVFQSYALYPHMTVAEHFAFPLKARKYSAPQIKSEVERIAELLDLAPLLSRLPRQLSAGQAQRVAIGRALIRKPRVFLLDEPLNNLDAQLRLYTRAVLKRLQRDLGVTTIYVTHDQEEAQSLADRIVVMNDGRVQQVGSPLAVYDTPANQFVAGFVGTPPMNFAPCTLQRDSDGRHFLVGSSFEVPVEPELARRMNGLEAALGRELLLGVRPEDITLIAEPTGGGGVARVYVTEPQGNELIVTLRFGEQTWKARLAADQRAAPLRPDQPVALRLNQNRVHLFDAHNSACLV